MRDLYTHDSKLLPTSSSEEKIHLASWEQSNRTKVACIRREGLVDSLVISKAYRSPREYVSDFSDSHDLNVFNHADKILIGQIYIIPFDY